MNHIIEYTTFKNKFQNAINKNLDVDTIRQNLTKIDESISVQIFNTCLNFSFNTEQVGKIIPIENDGTTYFKSDTKNIGSCTTRNYKLKDETFKQYNIFGGNVLTSVGTDSNLILKFKNATKQDNGEKNECEVSITKKMLDIYKISVRQKIKMYLMVQISHVCFVLVHLYKIFYYQIV